VNQGHRPPKRGRDKSIMAQLNRQNKQSQKMRATKGKDMPDPKPIVTRNDFAYPSSGGWVMTKIFFNGGVWGEWQQIPEGPPLSRSKRIGGIVAYRGWTLNGSFNDPVLQSVAVSTLWPEPVLVADGKPAENNHLAFTGRGKHGIYAYKTARDFFDGHGSTFVWGQVVLYGTVVVHERGYRAERAMIKNLVLSPQAWVKWGDNLATRLAQRYGCDVYTDYRELFKGAEDGGPR
jgi:hypothetical protein